MTLSSKAAKAETTTAEDFETVQDEMVALTMGAENIEDLIALLEGRGSLVATEDETTGDKQLMFQFTLEGDDAFDADKPTETRTWRSIWERVGGDVLKGRSLVNWMLGKRTKLQREIAEKKAFAEARKQEIDEWCSREVNRRQKSIGWFEDLMLAFHRRLGTKQESFPNGKVQWDKARVETEWDMTMGLRVAIESAMAEAEALTEEGCESEDVGERQAYLWARFYDVVAEYVDLKKTPVKDLLTKRKDGGFQWTDGDGVVHEVISVSETGEVPLVPLAEGESIVDTERKPVEWAKALETYKQVIK